MSLPPLQFACGIGVRSDSESLLAGLLEHFAGWHAPAMPPRFWVRAACDPGRSEDLTERLAPLLPHERDAYALDTGTVRAPAWRLDGTTVVFDEMCGCYYLPEDGGLTVLAHVDDALARLGLLRVVRELVCAATRDATTLDLHAAAVEIGGRAVVACGPKRAGKSSLLCQLLTSGQARYLANDRVRVAASGARLEARGIPTVVKLRAPTVDSFPALGAILSPAQLCARLGAEAGVQAPLGLVLHPRIVPDGPGWSLRALPRREARLRLAGAVYGVRRAEPTFLEELLPDAVPRCATEEARTLDRLASSVPQYLCELGPGAYAEPAGPLVAALDALCRSA